MNKDPNYPKKRIVIFSTILFFLSSTLISFATDFYVSTGGSDENSGTIFQPFKTISKGWTVLETGDTLYIRGGVYHESLLAEKAVEKSGTELNPITVRNYPGEVVAMSGGVVISEWQISQSQEDALGNPNWQNIYKTVIKKAAPLLIENGDFAYLASDKDHHNSSYPSLEIMNELPAVDDAVNDGQNLFIKDSTRSEEDDYWDGAIIKVWMWGPGVGNWIQNNRVASYVNKTFNFTEPMSAGDINSEEGRRDRYSLFNHPSLITKPGEYYYTDPDGEGNVTVYLWPQDVNNLNGKIEYSNLAIGILLRNDPNHVARPSHLKYTQFEGISLYGYDTAIGNTTQNETSKPWPHHLTFADLTIRSVKNGIYLPKYLHITVRGCNISNCSGYGIMMDRSDYAVIDNCNLSNIYIDSFRQTIGTGSRVTRNKFWYKKGSRSPHGHGITINGTSNSLFAHNFIYRGSLPLTTSSLGDNNFIYGNVIGVPWDGRWSTYGGDAGGSVWYVNNTVLNAWWVNGTPERYAMNNIRATLSGTFVPDGEISCIGNPGDYHTTLSITEEDMTELFIDGPNQNYRRNPLPISLEDFPLLGSSIEEFANLVKLHFPDYNLEVDITGSHRDLSSPIIGAYELSSSSFPWTMLVPVISGKREK